MRELLIDSSLKYIKNNNPNFDDNQIEIIEYGLVSIYLLISKLIIIILLAWLLGIVKELLIFTFLYNLIRMPSFGLHASKSWICLVLSTIMFLGVPIICLNIVVTDSLKLIIGSVLTIFICKNSPADTHKRPIISSKRRRFFKISSTIISVIFVGLSIFVKNNFLSNCLIAVIGCQTIFISPTVYKIFKLPYNNYKNYILEEN